MNEFNDLPGNKEAEEFKRLNNIDASEFKDVVYTEPKEFGSTAKSKAKKKTGAMTLSSMMALVAVAGVVSATAIVGDYNVDASILSLYAADTYISYYVEIVETDVQLSMILKNDFTYREQILDEEMGGEGNFEDLKPNMKYELALVAKTKGGDKTISKKTVRTKELISEPITEFYGADYECTCEVDGMFRFTMNFIDENGYWYNFYAEIIDSENNVAYVSIDDPFAQQSIDLAEGGIVGKTEGGIVGKTVTFRIYCTSVLSVESDGTFELYNVQVEL